MTQPIEEREVVIFNPDEYDWESHLKLALRDMPKKIINIDTCWSYYEGVHPKVWLTDGIREKLDDKLVTDMAENYCDVAVDAPIKRLGVTGFVNPKDNTVEIAAANNVWEENDLKLAQKDIYTDARCTGEAFLFAWKDDDKLTGIDATVVDPRRVWWPDSAHRADPNRVVQVWSDEEDGVWRATCYYKYVVVRLIGPKLSQGTGRVLPQARYFSVDTADPGGIHGFDRVPVIRFSRHKARRPLIDQIRSIQDKINKLSANMMVSAEFNAWRKTIILTEQKLTDGELSFRPNKISVLDPGGGPEGAAATSIWEGSASELSNYSNEIDKLIDKLFTKAVLPGHMKVKSTAVAPSGAAYEADEGPFTEDIEDMQDSFGESWHDWYDLVLGIDVDAQWRNPRVKSDKDEMDTVKVAIESGVPLTLALKKYAGWDDDELKMLEDSPLSPKEQLSMAAAQALANGGGLANEQSNQESNPTTDTNNGGSGGSGTNAGSFNA